MLAAQTMRGETHLGVHLRLFMGAVVVESISAVMDVSQSFTQRLHTHYSEENIPLTVQALYTPTFHNLLKSIMCMYLHCMYTVISLPFLCFSLSVTSLFMSVQLCVSRLSRYVIVHSIAYHTSYKKGLSTLL